MLRCFLKLVASKNFLAMQSDNDNLKVQTERKHSFGFWFGVAVMLIAFDQLTKFFAERNHWRIFYNQNFAFSIPLPIYVMYAIYIAVLIFVLRLVIKQWNSLTALARFGWALVIAGGLSNIAERVVLGFVRDFIYIFTGVFNLADFFIITGLLIIVFTYPKNFKQS